MQIVCGGNDLRFHDLLVIHRKTFAIIQQFETPYNKKEEKFAGKPSRLEANPRKFSTANDLHYTVYSYYASIMLNAFIKPIMLA